MSAPVQNLENHFVHKMDSKNRVSVPTEFRLVEEGTPIRIMRSTEHGEPVIKVFTEDHYQAKFAEIDQAANLNSAQKKQIISALRMFSKQVTINPQGKLTLPKDWCDKVGLRAEEQAVLGGCGEYFIICSQDAMSRMEENLRVLDDGGLGVL
ncbi:DNA-binding transcriptional regulator/RsmH inhibitor MraZ [Haloferula luteola]|uniref:DNA-binding transcriptional regulator/RsmH inhibitor MraZ n=1 Tax=Haloferula luteola TaxID=595692 RepID=A0A840V376_9BACT|nr:hypothetical protein [Haloferula luteola]MBB5351943.1 DNA-binding transcriptional regulator/RsmH inhibitor MraZ [Haloferula luteola]